MATKTCFKCGVPKPLSAFYRHAEMADGHLNKCKDCAKRDVGLDRQKNIKRYRAYDRARMTGKRLRAWAEAATAPRNLGVRRDARVAVGNAVRDGVLIPGSCEFCGESKAEAHHDNPRKPLEVRWLCVPCHKSWHAHLDGKKAWRLISLGAVPA
jgi:hypothetical protein